jgi:hypothetical protein
MDGLHERANDGRDCFAVGLKNAQADGRSDGIFVPRRIAAAMKIEADRGSFFLEGEAGPRLSKDDERNGAVDTRAAAAFQTGKRMKMIRGSG